MIITHFDSPDHYGEYDAETGCGGYGDEFTVEECKRYVEESGGFREFDYFLLVLKVRRNNTERGL